MCNGFILCGVIIIIIIIIIIGYEGLLVMRIYRVNYFDKFFYIIVILKVVLGSCRFVYVTLNTVAFKIWSTGSPAYLLPAVSNYTGLHPYTRHLRSSSQLLIFKPAVRTETARRSFNQAAPSV